MRFRSLLAAVIAASLASCADADSSKRNSVQPAPQPEGQEPSDSFRPLYFQQTGECDDHSVVFRFLKGEATWTIGQRPVRAMLRLAIKENGEYRAFYFEDDGSGVQGAQRARNFVGLASRTREGLWLDGLGFAELDGDRGRHGLRIRFATKLVRAEITGQSLSLKSHAQMASPFPEFKACAEAD